MILSGAKMDSSIDISALESSQERSTEKALAVSTPSYQGCPFLRRKTEEGDTVTISYCCNIPVT